MSENPNVHEKSVTQKISETSRHFVIYLIGAGFQGIVSFILIPLYTKYLNVEQYGSLALINLVAILASGLFYLGVTSSLSRYFYEYESNDRDLVLNTSFYLSIAGALLQIVLGFFFSRFIALRLFGSYDYSDAIFYNLLSTAFMFINNILYLILRYLKKSLSYVVINFTGLLINLVLSLLLLKYATNKINAATIALFVSQLVLTIILISYCYSYLSRKISLSHIKEQLAFGLPAAYSGFLIYLIEWSDRLVLNKYLSLHDVGLYSFGYRLGTMIQAFYIIPFCLIWAPIRMEYHKDQNTTKLFQVMLTYYFLVGMIITSFISIFSDVFIKIFSRSTEYISAYRFIPIIMFSILIYGSVNILDFGIFIKRKPIYFTLILLFVVIVNFLLNYFLVPYGGVFFAAFNKLFSYLILAFLVYFISNKLYTFPIEVLRITSIILISFSSFIISSFINTDSTILNLSIKSIIFLVEILAIFLFVLSEVEVNYIKSFIIKLFKSFKTSITVLNES